MVFMTVLFEYLNPQFWSNEPINFNGGEGVHALITHFKLKRFLQKTVFL